MKVALEFGEALEVALLENNRVVGSLSLVLRTAGAAPRVAAAPAKAAAPAAAKASRKRRQLSPEARARMATAQKERWAKKRAADGGQSSE